ncbi:hypothetical protein K438DRAFT_1747480 [Mycena galopus ATCC 62051]|nr:hypothetical protein K438DRAFT_1747480 [Mycena galopus ATCC 62051]
MARPVRSAIAETSLESPTPNRTRIAFISGPLAPTPNYFTEHYVPRLDTAIADRHAFVIGPSRGIDTLTLAYLLGRSVPPSSITVFLSDSEHARQREFVSRGVKVVVVGRGHTERDAAMTAASDYDILWYQTEAECRALYGRKYRPRVSGTQLNEIRRQEIQAATLNTTGQTIVIPSWATQRTPTIPVAQPPRSVVAETSLGSPAPARVAFVSGPLEPTPNYFAEHYAPRLDIAIGNRHAFVIGPSRGIDTLTLAYLLQRGVPPSSITVFLSNSEHARQREFVRQGLKAVVVGRGHTERDAAMTAASDYDILRYQTEAECRALYGPKYRPRVSGTQLNEIRRQEMLAAALNTIGQKITTRLWAK